MASCNKGRMWSRTYMVAYTAKMKKRIHQRLTPCSNLGSARMIKANDSPWRNSSLHQRSNQRKMG